MKARRCQTCPQKIPFITGFKTWCSTINKNSEFYANNRNDHATLIQAFRYRMYLENMQDQSFKKRRSHCVQYIKRMGQCLINPIYYNIMNNFIKMRQCNYNKCNRKDLAKYKICKRCKSVFYCCRRHQKLDWNRGDHKTFCVERESRDYSIFERSFKFKINDKKIHTTLRLFC